MRVPRTTAIALALGLATPAFAQQPPTASSNAGRDLVVTKCFQCHTDAMFRDQHQDRRAWEATIYRMMGRGGLWTPEERALMADFLATAFGPQSQAAVAPQK